MGGRRRKVVKVQWQRKKEGKEKAKVSKS